MLEKPTYGGPCNNCGLCCMAQQCPLSSYVFGDKALCPALLRPATDGAYSCGLVEKPGLYFDVSEADELHPRVASIAARVLVGVGVGCDARTIDEPPNPGASRRIKAYSDAIRAVQVYKDAFRVIDTLKSRLRPEFR
jgi:hypothetical protein